MKTIEELRAEAAKYDVSAYWHDGDEDAVAGWYIREDGTFPYWGHSEGGNRFTTEGAALVSAIEAMKGEWT